MKIREIPNRSLTEEKEFEIIHLSFRKKYSPDTFGGPVHYYIGNIVFRMYDSMGVERLKNSLNEYESFRVSLDKDKLEKYFSGLNMRFGEEDPKTKLAPVYFENDYGLKDEEVFVTGHRLNMNPLHGFIEYHEKFDCYQMREYFQDNPVVRGMIQYLEDMKNGVPNPTRNCEYEQFLNTLTTLCWWWD